MLGADFRRRQHTHLILPEEPLHLLICFCVLVLNNQLTPPVANLWKQDRSAAEPRSSRVRLYPGRRARLQAPGLSGLQIAASRCHTQLCTGHPEVAPPPRCMEKLQQAALDLAAPEVSPRTAPHAPCTNATLFSKTILQARLQELVRTLCPASYKLSRHPLPVQQQQSHGAQVPYRPRAACMALKTPVQQLLPALSEPHPASSQPPVNAVSLPQYQPGRVKVSSRRPCYCLLGGSHCAGIHLPVEMNVSNANTG